MNRKWNKIATVIKLNDGVHFEHNPDGSVNLHNDHMDAINGELEANSTSIETLTSEKKSAEDKAAEQQAAAETANTQVQDLSGKVSQLEADLNTTKQALTTANASLQQANADLLVAKEKLARRPIGGKPILNNSGGGDDDVSFEEKAATYAHNQEIDALLGKK